MQIGLPQSYPTPCALPFNRESLASDFQLRPPDLDPAGPGVWLLLQGSKLIVKNSAEGPELPSENIAGQIPGQKPLYIGNWQGRPCRMLKISQDQEFGSEYFSHSLHASEPQIPLSMLSLAGVGLMIQHWEKSSQFCGYCGKRLVRLKNEWGKSCSDCNNHHFPRIHPCAIGLVVKGEEILLVRKAEWVNNRYGLVAGFVEFGESLEEAMAREISEETGLRVTNIRYLGSQCWPFPSQIMTGFVCDYLDGEINLLDNELEAADWFRLDSLPTLPPRRSIARYLIDRAAEFLQP